MQWSWRHAIAVGVGRGSSQGGSLGPGSGPAPWWPQPTRPRSPLAPTPSGQRQVEGHKGGGRLVVEFLAWKLEA
jgi:hypothetical protein